MRFEVEYHTFAMVTVWLWRTPSHIASSVHVRCMSTRHVQMINAQWQIIIAPHCHNNAYFPILLIKRVARKNRLDLKRTRHLLVTSKCPFAFPNWPTTHLKFTHSKGCSQWCFVPFKFLHQPFFNFLLFGVARNYAMVRLKRSRLLGIAIVATFTRWYPLTPKLQDIARNIPGCSAAAVSTGTAIVSLTWLVYHLPRSMQRQGQVNKEQRVRCSSLL